MRIVMATHYFGSHRGGIELVAERLFEELAALNQEIAWIASDITPPPEIYGQARVAALPVSNVIENRLGVPLPIPGRTAFKKIRAEVQRADILMLHDCLYLTNMAAFFYARSRKVPILIVQHTGAGAYSRGTLSWVMKVANRLVTRPMLTRAQQVVFISETVRNFFACLRFNSPPEVVFNGVDADVFRPSAGADEKNALRKALGLPAGRPVILFVGRFVEWKGLPVLKQLVDLAPDYTWAFAGSGPLDPGKWRAANVHVFSHLSGSPLAELYRACDLFALPSLREGFPLVIQEALASGLPVLCGSETLTADPPMANLVRGIKLSPGDDRGSAVAFLAAIREALVSSPDSQETARRRNFARSRYSWRLAAERYLQIASSLVHGVKQSPDDKPSPETLQAEGKTGLGQGEASS